MCSHCNYPQDFSVPGSKIENPNQVTVKGNCDENQEQDYVINKEKADKSVSI